MQLRQTLGRLGEPPGDPVRGPRGSPESGRFEPLLEKLLPSAAVGSGVISPWHIAIFVMVVLVCFGPKRLPEMGRMLGKGMREFKDGITHHHEQLDEPTTAPPAPRALDPTRDRDTI